MKHLLAIEDHARNLRDNYSASHVSCITKHLLQAEEQSDEAISHSSVVKPDTTKTFNILRSEIIKLRNRLTSGMNQIELINSVRGVRRYVEKLNPAYDIEKCKVCSNIIDSSDFGGKDINTVQTNKDIIDNSFVGDKLMDKNTFGVIQAGQFVGVGVKEIANYVDKKTGKTGMPAFKRPSTYIDLGAGLAASLASLYMKKGSDEVKLGLAVAGSQRLADKSVSLSKEYIPASGTGMGARMVPRSVPVTPRMPMGTGNGLVVVD